MHTFADFSVFISIRDGILEVEYPLIEDKLNKIDQEMTMALLELNWTSPGRLLLLVYNFCMHLYTATRCSMYF